MCAHGARGADGACCARSALGGLKGVPTHILWVEFYASCITIQVHAKAMRAQ